MDKSLTRLDELGSVMGEAIIIDYTNQSLYQLRSTVIDLNLDKKVEKKLLKEIDHALKHAQKAGDSVLDGKEKKAWKKLDKVNKSINKFIDKVEKERGKKISEEDADVLINQALKATEGIDGGSLNLLAKIDEFDITLSTEIIEETDEKIEEIQDIIAELEALGAEVNVTVEEHSPLAVGVVIVYGGLTLYEILSNADAARLESYAIEHTIVEQRGYELSFKERVILYNVDIVGASAFGFPSGIKSVLKRSVEFALKISLERPALDKLKEMKIYWMTGAVDEGYSERQIKPPPTKKEIPKTQWKYLTPENRDALEDALILIFLPPGKEFTTLYIAVDYYMKANLLINTEDMGLIGKCTFDGGNYHNHGALWNQVYTDQTITTVYQSPWNEHGVAVNTLGLSCTGPKYLITGGPHSELPIDSIVQNADYYFTGQRNRVNKWALGVASRLAYVDLSPTAMDVSIAIMEIGGPHYLFICTSESPFTMRKLDTDLAQLAVHTGDTGENQCWSITAGGGYVYAGIDTIPFQVVKIDPTTMAKVGKITGVPGEEGIGDIHYGRDGYLYVSTSIPPYKIIRYDPNTLTRTASRSVNGSVYGMVSDSKYLYATTYSIENFEVPSEVLKIYLSTFTIVDRYESSEALLGIDGNVLFPNT